MIEIGKYIHTLRVNNGYTLTKLGGLVGIDSGALSKIENGKKDLDKRLLPKIAEVFEIDLDQLKLEHIGTILAKEVELSGLSKKDVLLFLHERLVESKPESSTIS